MAGNWLIVGPMPAIPPGVTTSTQHLRLALTVDAVGNNLIAAASGNHTCPSFWESFDVASALTGTMAQDSTFSLQTPSAYSNIAMTITGKAPVAPETSWVGNYTVSFGALPGGTSCVETLSDSFTATFFPLVSGVYTGTASSTTSINGVPTTTTMALQMTLQQGGTATDTVTGKAVTNNFVLNGSIKVQGSPCFSSGTITGPPMSSVLGNVINARFTMDDGSTLEMIGSLTDASESRIATDVVLITGGQCGGSTFVAYRLTELDRQN